MNRNYPNDNTNFKYSQGVPNELEKQSFADAAARTRKKRPVHEPDELPGKRGRINLLIICLCVLLIVLIVLTILVITKNGKNGETKSTTQITSEKTSVPTSTPVITVTSAPTNPPIMPTSEPTSDLGEKINYIRKRYYDVENNINIYKIEQNGNIKKYFSPAGTLARVDVSLENGGEIYYYDNGSLYFVFAFSEDTEQRFYYDNGKLLRWIERVGNMPDQIYESTDENTAFGMYEKKWLDAADEHKAKVKYRVRTSYADIKGQIGAFENLENAKRTAEENPGYKVYNMYGTLIYDPTEN